MDNKTMSSPSKSETKAVKNTKKLNTPTTSSAQNTKKPQDSTKLKKAIIVTSAIIAAIAVLVLSVVLIINSSPIGKLLTQLNKDKNYHMTATVSGIPFVGSLTMDQLVDGNVTFTSAFLFSSDQYKEIVGEDTYIYTKDSSGKWTKTKSDGSGNSTEDMIEDLVGDIDELTNPKNYEKIKGEKNKYQQKESVEFEGCKDVVITIEDGKITVAMTIDFEGIDLPTTVVITEIGEIELTLPEVE